MKSCRVISVLALLLISARAPAQTPDTLRLGAMQESALRRDPRGRELELLSAQSRLRLKTLDAERRPSLSLESQAQYQSDVARIPITLPGGVTPPTPPHDTYDARLAANQRLYDPALASRRAVEDAQLAESQSRLRVVLFGVRQSVNDLYFASLRAQSQIAELETTITDLDAQARVAAARVREGAALPSEELALRAELLRRRQVVAELGASRRASLDVLADLTGLALDSVSVLDTPDLAGEVAQARTGLANVRARAEYEQFARTRALLERQENARAAQDRPRVSAFGRVGYGRPGLNPLNDTFDAYWLQACSSSGRRSTGARHRATAKCSHCSGRSCRRTSSNSPRACVAASRMTWRRSTGSRSRSRPTTRSSRCASGLRRRRACGSRRGS